MYYLPKIHKTPVAARFIVAWKYYSSKPLYDVISKVLKMIFNHSDQNFILHMLTKVLGCRKFIPNWHKINTKKKTKSISTFYCIVLYKTIPHNHLIKAFSEVINSVCKSKNLIHIGFLEASIFWTSIGCERRNFTRRTLIDTIFFLITKCYFTIRSVVFKQDIGHSHS